MELPSKPYFSNLNVSAKEMMPFRVQTPQQFGFILHTSKWEVNLVAIYGVDELLLRLLQPLLHHYFFLLLFVYPLISQLPIIYCVLFMGILHAHINQSMLNLITELMERNFSYYGILLIYSPCSYWPTPKTVPPGITLRCSPRNIYHPT